MFRIKKGHHGYIKRKKCLLLGEVLGLLIGIIGLVVIGVVTTGSRKNLLTVVAMVSVIPMVNQLVILIALWKYQPCPDNEYEQVASIVGKGILDTELVITSKTDKSFLLDYACIHEKGVFCYCSDKNVSEKKTAEYIKSFMKANDLKTDIFVIRDWKNYLNRIRELEKWDRASCDEKLLKIEGVLRGIAI